MSQRIVLCWTILFSILLHAQTEPSADSIRQFYNVKGQTLLNLPVREAREFSRRRILCYSQVLDQFTIRLATGAPDWVAFDVMPCPGTTPVLEISREDIRGAGAFADASP